MYFVGVASAHIRFAIFFLATSSSSSSSLLLRARFIISFYCYVVRCTLAVAPSGRRRETPRIVCYPERCHCGLEIWQYGDCQNLCSAHKHTPLQLRIQHTGSLYRMCRMCCARVNASILFATRFISHSFLSDDCSTPCWSSCTIRAWNSSR